MHHTRNASKESVPKREAVPANLIATRVKNVSLEYAYKNVNLAMIVLMVFNVLTGNVVDVKIITTVRDLKAMAILGFANKIYVYRKIVKMTKIAAKTNSVLLNNASLSVHYATTMKIVAAQRSVLMENVGRLSAAKTFTAEEMKFAAKEAAPFLVSQTKNATKNLRVVVMFALKDRA